MLDLLPVDENTSSKAQGFEIFSSKSSDTHMFFRFACSHIQINVYRTIQQQQLSHLSQVLGAGYMNQKRITLDRAHGSTFSTHSYRTICLH